MDIFQLRVGRPSNFLEHLHISFSACFRNFILWETTLCCWGGCFQNTGCFLVGHVFNQASRPITDFCNRIKVRQSYFFACPIHINALFMWCPGTIENAICLGCFSPACHRWSKMYVDEVETMYGHLLLQYKHVPNIPVKQEPIRPKIWHMFLQGRGCVGVVYFHVLLNMLGWYFIKGCVQQLNNHAVLNNKNPMPSVSIWPTNNGTKMNRSNTEPRLNLEKIYAHHCANRTCASLIRQTRNGKNTWIAVFVQAPC